jgi:hypothetical protein
MEKKLNGNYLKLVAGLCTQDRQMAGSDVIIIGGSEVQVNRD